VAPLSTSPVRAAHRRHRADRLRCARGLHGAAESSLLLCNALQPLQASTGTSAVGWVLPGGLSGQRRSRSRIAPRASSATGRALAAPVAASSWARRGGFVGDRGGVRHPRPTVVSEGPQSTTV